MLVISPGEKVYLDLSELLSTENCVHSGSFTTTCENFYFFEITASQYKEIDKLFYAWLNGMPKNPLFLVPYSREELLHEIKQGEWETFQESNVKPFQLAIKDEIIKKILLTELEYLVKHISQELN